MKKREKRAPCEKQQISCHRLICFACCDTLVPVDTPVGWRWLNKCNMADHPLDITAWPLLSLCYVVIVGQASSQWSQEGEWGKEEWELAELWVTCLFYFGRHFPVSQWENVLFLSIGGFVKSWQPDEFSMMFGQRGAAHRPLSLSQKSCLFVKVKPWDMPTPACLYV